MQIEEYEQDHHEFTKDQSEADKRLHVVFYTGMEPDNEASRLQGRPVFREREFVRITVPGDRTSVVVHPLTDEDKVRFPAQWKAYEAGQKGDAALVGTPLQAWPMISRAQVEEFKFFHIHTVEQLADLREDVKGKFLGAAQLCQRAKDWLAAAKDTEQVARMRTELEERDKMLASQNERLEALEKALLAKNEPVADASKSNQQQRARA